jgi:DNA replicative helicase MCM subunit Mcm2 (Cdc46/Mcm family)
MTSTNTRLSANEQAEVLKWPKMDIGIFEADTRNKKISLGGWSRMDLSKVDYEKELASGVYDNGIAIRCGKTLSGKHYVIALDFDRWKAVVAWFGSWEKVLVLAEKTPIEWHEDKESIHVILLSDQPVENRKIHIGDGRLEILCEGQALFVSPSIHKEGKSYTRLGSCETPRLLEREELLRLRTKIDFLCTDYMSDADKQAYDRWLDEPTTILGVRAGRHDATKFKVCSYYFKYSGEWLDLSDEERFKRAWDWHNKHCNPPRPMKEFNEICKWVVREHKRRRDELHARVRHELNPIVGTHLWQEKTEEGAVKTDKDLSLLSVSEAFRILPEKTEDHTEILKVGGMISSQRPVFKMFAGEYGKCPKCGEEYHKHYEKPSFYHLHEMIPFCTKFDALEHPAETVGVEKGKGRFFDEAGNEYEFQRDSKGRIVRTKVWLKTGFEYRNAVIVEIQDVDKFDDLQRLEVILFDADTENVRAGEQITVTGQIWIEYLSEKRDSRLTARLYAHSIQYEARREITLSNLDKDAIHRFVNRFRNKTVEQLSKMFAAGVIGYGHVKTGLLISAASCSINDFRSHRAFRHRVRIHSFLIGDPGLKSILLREIVRIVSNSRFESLQNTTGKSLTAIVSKEGGENTVLRLGPAPLAKGGILAANELGRMMYEDQAPLLDVMEEGEFTITKYGINANIRASTVIIGSANPTTANLGEIGKVTLDDIPAIKPILDRFDLLFFMRTTRDIDAIKRYTYAKSDMEDRAIPNYNAYLEKHLLYAQRFNPRISEDVKMILNQYYIGIAAKIGSPRVRETLFNLTRMIARLKLKHEADADDATEACSFYNVILVELNHVVNIPGNPRDIAFNEFLYSLETTQAP